MLTSLASATFNISVLGFYCEMKNLVSFARLRRLAMITIQSAILYMRLFRIQRHKTVNKFIMLSQFLTLL